jgi:hypothetical protein
VSTEELLEPFRVSDGKMCVRKAVTMADNFQSGQFVNDYGYRFQGKLPTNPSLRPDNIKCIETELAVLSTVDGPYADAAKIVNPLH